jgi:RimJ/RimL family protein N-acetyltransferase
MRAVYLTGERVYLRALVADDRGTVATWFAAPFPSNAARGEDWLKEVHSDAWSANKPHYLAIVRIEDDAPIGGVSLAIRGSRRGFLRFVMAPWLAEADRLRAEALRLIVPWVRDDLELMSFEMPVAADESATRAAAEELGLFEAARLREFVARPGGRVDRLMYQALNAPWRVADA